MASSCVWERASTTAVTETKRPALLGVKRMGSPGHSSAWLHTMRVTSAYSGEARQVEPRAEFESWLVRDRLKLRFQAPLSGARAGQKAQAELRLGDNTAIQYQWDNDNPDVKAGDHGLDLRLRWEWNE